jgi:hypothetical protein
MSIPSIQEIFSSRELSKVIAVFSKHLDETKKEAEQISALGTFLRQLLNMLKDQQNIESIYNYLDANHSAESEELKAALNTVFSEPVKEITAEALPDLIIDTSDIDLSLELLSKQDLPELTAIIKQCCTENTDLILSHWDFNGFDTPDCRWFYKIVQGGQCAGAVGLAYVGTEAMLIRNIAYTEKDNNIYVFELLKRLHPDYECWNIYYPHNENDKEDFCFDFEGKKRQFGDDNGFEFYTNSRWNRYIKILKPHDEFYNSPKYRFALLDGAMDGVSFRFFGVDKLDWYDGKMTNWRITDCNFSGTLVYDSWLGNSKFYESTIDDCEFRYVDFSRGIFSDVSFEDCKIENCNLSGMTIDGINVKEVLEYYKNQK